MKYIVEFAIEGTIEVEAANEEAAEDIVEGMDLHELIEDADDVRIEPSAYEMDEEE